MFFSYYISIRNKKCRSQAIGEFVEASLAPHFGAMIAFVNECEPLVNQQASNLLVRYNGMV